MASEAQIEAALEAYHREFAWFVLKPENAPKPEDAHRFALAAALAAAEAVAWEPVESAPPDGGEFLGLLSNGWRIVMCATPNMTKGRYQWWGTARTASVPYEPSHPADTDWAATHTIRLVRWQPLPAPPQEMNDGR